MKVYGFTYTYDKHTIEETDTRLQELITNTHHHIAEGLHNHYRTEYACVALPFDTHMRKLVLKLIDKKKHLKPSMLVVVGIGGSNLGTQAVYDFVYGPYPHTRSPIPCYFLDTLNEELVHTLLCLIDQQIKDNNTILINVISKSGTTVETLAHFYLLLEHLKRQKPDTYQESFVITTAQGSPLWDIARKIGCDLLEIPQYIGGRFSIFSAVSLFPLGILDINIEALHYGARTIVTDLIDNKNTITQKAALISYHQLKQGRPIHDMLMFDPSMESLGKWYRQLFAETLGKQNDLGITPTVSIGSTDLHSMGQLYCGGPDDKYYMIGSVANHIPHYQIHIGFDTSHTITMSNCMKAIQKGLERVFSEDKRPYENFILSDKDTYSCAQFFQFYMLRVIYLAGLLKVNPFDQPHVEQYKQEMKDIINGT